MSGCNHAPQPPGEANGLTMPLEIEVKFLLDDPDSIRTRLEDLGARSSGRHFETNLRLDDGNRSLLGRGALLRLRFDRRALLTYKEKAPGSDAEFKVHRELEVAVEDFNRMEQILEAIGFSAVQRYEKWRETFRLEGVAFCLDTLPFGAFLEIEGEKDAIRRFSRRLELPWGKRILDNYLHIFELLKEREGLAFSDVTFDNFKGCGTDIGALVPLLEAGNG
jgi:adenylate cyclase class 2